MAQQNPFPKSIFPLQMLNESANRFKIDPGYYDGSIRPRNANVLTQEEKDHIFGKLDDTVQETILNLYKRMQPVDAFIFGPRLPQKTLRDTLDMTGDEVHSLKILCNTLRDMSEEEYQRRYEAMPKDFSLMVNQLKPWLNFKNVMKIPGAYINDFLHLPMYLVKQNWQGTRFKKAYSAAVSYYKKGE